MKRYYLAFICILFVITAQSQTISLPQKITEECYGNLRADMTRSVCAVCNVKDTVILNSIESYSLSKFLQKRDGILKIIIPRNMTLDGPDISKLHSQIRDIKGLYESNLIHNYPDKADSIIAEFRKYDALIAALSIECIVFNRDTTSAKKHYLSRYPQGRFIVEADSIVCRSGVGFRDEKDILIADLQREISLLKEDINNLKNIETPSTPNNSQSKDNAWIYIFIICISLLIIVLLLFKKKYPKQYKTFIINISSIYRIIIKNNKTLSGNNTSIESPRVDTKLEDSTGNKCDESINKVGNDLQPKAVPEKKERSTQIQTEKFAIENNEWIIVGASVIGRGHVESNMPCQDSNSYASLGNGWGIAITSDGAGSAKHSHVGSKIVVTRAKSYFEKLILNSSWYKNNILPDDITWSKAAFKALKAVRDDMQKFAEEKQAKLESFAATVIVVVHTPMGLLVAHIGDGRAGYQDKSGTWHSLITPHKGEEANQTIFITSDFWNIPFYEMSGVSVPETRVIRESVKSFVLMSDGCEHTSWDCNLYDSDKGIYYDPNTPHVAFFNPLIETLKEHKKEQLPFIERSEKWSNYLDKGNKSFIKETDDKTMILGTIS